jgi:alginate O-acetyltransferase complex protein AlgI
VLPGAVGALAASTWPRWAFMWALAFAIYAGCKWLTWRRTPVCGVPLWKHLGYLLAWPGLDAAAFLNPHPPALPRPSPGEWLFAAAKSALGLGLLFGVARLVPLRYPYLAGWVGMIGIVMVLHFGLFHLLSCAWRQVGVEARPLMSWPLLSTSVSEFWGRRWNSAFRDLTHRFLFRPLSNCLGPRWALGGGFLFSGLVHDLVISVPAGGGYGGPSLFFALQGVALLLERTAIARRLGLGQGWRGWLFTLLVLLAPVAGLFHPPFVLAIVLPFLRALGAVHE